MEPKLSAIVRLGELSLFGHASRVERSADYVIIEINSAKWKRRRTQEQFENEQKP